ncbi:MAG: tetratricopeptide repeat protein [Bacteroidota bacterium]
MKTLVVLSFLVGSFLLAGCSGSGQVAVQKPAEKPDYFTERQQEINRDRALRHFIDGAAHDANGEYAEAILEYQEALQYDPNAAIHYALSKDYSILNKPARAAEAGREAVRLDPKNITYHENLATISLNSFQQDLAIKEYEVIVELDSTSTSAWFNLARLYQPTRPLKALEIYERLIDRIGDDWDLLLQTAELYGSLGRYKEASEKYKRMLEIDPSNKPLQRQLAESFGKAGEFDEAIRLLESMLEVDHNDFEVILVLADVYLDRHEYDKAIELYQRALQTQGQKSNPELKLRIGIAYFGKIQQDSTLTPRAKKMFEEVNRELPNDWRSYWYLGAIAANDHQDSIATTYFEQVTKLAEWNADAWYYVGSNYFERGEYKKLLDLMEKAKKVLPKEYRLYLLMGLAYSRLEQSEQAATMLERAYELNPKDLNTLSSLALTYDGMRRYQDSDRIYEEALKVDPKSALLLNNFSYSLAERGLQLQRALEMAVQAVTAEPDNASYLDTLGWIYFKIGKYDEAEKYVEKAVETGKGSSVVVEHLGDVYSKLGQKEKALEMWQKALEMNSKNQALKEKIDRGS